MEKELNTAAILKDKPKGTKLWSDTFGIVSLLATHSDSFDVKDANCTTWGYSSDGSFTNYKGALCIFPSREMRDWSKFAWKKGDVLTTKTKSLTVVFEHFNATYESFVAKYSFCSYLEKNKDDAWNKEGENSYKTLCFSKVSDDEAKEFIKKVESHYGGKLNLFTLTIEQPKPEFKDGDIVFYESGIDNVPNNIFILRGSKQPTPFCNYYACLDSDGFVISNNCHFTMYNDNFRLATDSEKQQLFDALAKEGKVWNPDTLQIEDLSKKYEFKAFDYFIAKDKNYSEAIWILYQYAFTYKEYKRVYMINGDYIREDLFTILPYNDSTKHLLGTTDEWKGGEG